MEYRKVKFEINYQKPLKKDKHAENHHEEVNDE
jgi:hypothetical protein